MMFINGDKWFKPSEIYKEGLIRNSKNKPDYRFILRLINRGHLHAKAWNTSGSKPYFMVSKYEIDRYNGNIGQKPTIEYPKKSIPEEVSHVATRQVWVGHCQGCCNQGACVMSGEHCCPNHRITYGPRGVVRLLDAIGDTTGELR